jgi:ribosome biogenesis GTPase
MLPLRGGGRVIDSPGVRDYAPALPADAKVETGYREIHAVADECRFANCKHLREPSCAVKNEVDEGGIDERRYESYRRLLALQERLNRKRY